MAVHTEQFQPVYYKGMGAHVATFMERYIVQSKGRWAGQPIVLESWQRDVLDELFLMRPKPDGELERVYRQALIGIARKNGKSTLAAGLAIHGLVAAGENAPEVYAAAAATDQARIIFDQSRKFIEGSPLLRDYLRVYRSVIECKANGGIFKVLSADGPLQHGLNPSLVLIDELWAHKDPELYYALTTGSGARLSPLIVSITTAGWSRESVLWQVYEFGEALLAQGGLDAMRAARHFHRWFSALPEQEVTDRNGWHRANPSSWIVDDDLEISRQRLPEAVFRRLHLNQWTESRESWIKPHEWDSCSARAHGLPRPTFDPHAPTWIAADIGVRRDCAAIVWAQWHGDKLHIGQEIMDPEEEGRSFGVADVRGRLAERARRMTLLKEAAYDPWSFRESAEILAELGMPMVEFPQNASRLAPASETVYELILQRRLVHDGDPVMRSHVLSAVVSPTDRGGWRISKRKSLERIDGCVALTMTADRASTMRFVKPKRKAAAFL